MTARAAFTQADVARAVKGCLAGGMAVGTVRILPSGAIEVYAAAPEAESPAAPGRNPLDRLHGLAP